MGVEPECRGGTTLQSDTHSSLMAADLGSWGSGYGAVSLGLAVWTWAGVPQGGRFQSPDFSLNLISTLQLNSSKPKPFEPLSAGTGQLLVFNCSGYTPGSLGGAQTPVVCWRWYLIVVNAAGP